MGRAKKPKRIVLGAGHPWYSGRIDGGFSTVQLTRKPVPQSILLRGGEELVPLKHGGTGNWNKVRLVLEVLE